MSKATRFSTPSARPYSAAPMQPPTGPDSTSVIGSRQPRSAEITPPCEPLSSSDPPNPPPRGPAPPPGPRPPGVIRPRPPPPGKKTPPRRPHRRQPPPNPAAAEACVELGDVA